MILDLKNPNAEYYATENTFQIFYQIIFFDQFFQQFLNTSLFRREKKNYNRKIK